MVSETNLFRQGLEQLRSRLPPGWRVEVEPSAPGIGAIARLTAPDGTTGRLAIACERRVAPGAVPNRAASADVSSTAQPVVFAGWVSPLARQALVDQGIGYVDATGNVDLRVAAPGLFVRDVGAPHDPEPPSSALKSLKGAGAARAVRALVDFVPPYGVRELAMVSGASAALVSRVVGLLEREALVTRDGAITAIDWEKVLRRWAEDYAFSRVNRVVPFLDPRGTAAFLRKLGNYGETWAATGTLGVPAGVRVVPLQLATLYVPSPEQTAEQLDLVPTTIGANVLLVEPADTGAFVRTERGADGVVRCAPSQVVADLLTGPGRGASEASALLGWMAENERIWRHRP